MMSFEEGVEITPGNLIDAWEWYNSEPPRGYQRGFFRDPPPLGRHCTYLLVARQQYLHTTLYTYKLEFPQSIEELGNLMYKGGEINE